MLYGLYLSAGGAAANQRSLEVTAHNLANAGATGFKRDLALAGHHRPHADNFSAGGSPFAGLAGAFDPFGFGANQTDQTGGNSLAATALDLAQGPLEETGGDLDVALAGPGFFQVDDGGTPVLTRDGRFTRAADGTLVTADGARPVLAAGGGTIALPPGAAAVTISGDGTVSATLPGGGTAALGRLNVVIPQSPDSLRKLGDGRLVHDGPARPANPGETQLRQGYIEGSGVDAVKETMSMIEASRGFETNLNLVKLQDDTLGRLLNVVRP